MIRESIDYVFCTEGHFYRKDIKNIPLSDDINGFTWPHPSDCKHSNINSTNSDSIYCKASICRIDYLWDEGKPFIIICNQVGKTGSVMNKHEAIRRFAENAATLMLESYYKGKHAEAIEETGKYLSAVKLNAINFIGSLMQNRSKIETLAKSVMHVHSIDFVWLEYWGEDTVIPNPPVCFRVDNGLYPSWSGVEVIEECISHGYEIADLNQCEQKT